MEQTAGSDEASPFSSKAPFAEWNGTPTARRAVYGLRGSAVSRWADGPSVTLLLTGITGFLGGATAAHLLTHHAALRLVALVRGESVEDARARARRSLGRFLDSDALAAAERRLEVVVGSLEDTGLVFPPEQIARYTHVLHLAACTSFHSTRRVWLVNFDGALRLARHASTFPRLQRYVHVGTAYACGVTSNRVFGEDDADADVHLVDYTRSKMECERRLRETAPSLPLVVARPSVVVGHTTLGCAPSSSIYWYVRALHRLGRAPFPRGADTQWDVVPVDWVAWALELLLYKPSLSYSRYHLSSGESYSDAWRDIVMVLDAELGAATEPTVARAFNLGPSDARRVGAAIDAFDRFSRLSVECFDNHRLLSEGVPPPPRLTSYLARCAAPSKGPRGRTIVQELDDEV